ncbi:MAG: hypothetical protein J1E05_05415 [Eubacterium sp.]|nr:hypothetical protein [Eubacterium sp.]
MDILEKRFIELADRAEERCYFTFSDFLNMEEKSLLESLKLNTEYCFFGGYDMAERCVAAFGYGCESAEFPISIIKAEPVSPKFADKLSHRDFLGSLMGLGIKREVVGDIVIADNIGYIFCLNSIADYITQSLDKVKHTTVKCSVIDTLPEAAQSIPEEKQLIAASERLDVIIAAVYNFSRSEAKEFFINRKIFVNSALCANFSRTPKAGDIISVRGKGRFVYNGVLGNTKKNRLIISVGIYK